MTRTMPMARRVPTGAGVVHWGVAPGRVGAFGSP